MSGLLNTTTERKLWVFLIGLSMGVMAVFAQFYIKQMGLAVPFLTPLAQASVSEKDRARILVSQKLATPNTLLSLLYPEGRRTEAAGLPVSSAYLVVRTDTGEVIQSKYADEQLPIASLTKIMTAVVALDLAHANDTIQIEERAAAQIPTKIGLKAGERLSLDELLHATLMTSANDAAEAIRQGIDTMYGSPVFIDAMNEKAKKLGLTNTHFANPQGFDAPDNYSTAHDMAVLSHYAFSQYPLIAEIAKKEVYELNETHDHRRFDLYNWNGLLGVYPDAIGLKIGNTRDAGKTTVVMSERGHIPLLTVVLGTESILDRDLSAAQLLDIGYQKIANLHPINITESKLKLKYASWNTL